VVARTLAAINHTRESGKRGVCPSGVFACKRGGELRRWKSNGNGAVAMIIDPCQVPTVVAKAFIRMRRRHGRREGSSTKREGSRLRRYPREWQEGGGSWARKGRRVNRWRMRKQKARGTLLNFRHPWRTNSKGRRAVESSLDKGFALTPLSSHLRSFLNLPTLFPLPGLSSPSNKLTLYFRNDLCQPRIVFGKLDNYVIKIKLLKFMLINIKSVL